jgi:hypothetical protein
MESMSFFQHASNVTADYSSFNNVQGNQTNHVSYIAKQGKPKRSLGAVFPTDSLSLLVDPHDECLTIAEWLSSLDFKEKQSDIFEKRADGTGQWLLESAPFQDWLEGKSRILWCSGMRE